MNFKRSSLAAVFLGLAFSAYGRVDAAWMTYTETATASGSLGTVKFTNATITFSQTADTGSVYAGEGLNYLSQVADVTATVDISGIGKANLTTATDTFANRGSTFAGIAFHGDSYDIILLTVFNSSFSNYDLKSSLGPLAGSTLFGERMVSTDHGLLSFVPDQGSLVFAATLSPVPEPSTILMLTSGLALAFLHNSRLTRGQKRAG